MTVRAMIRHAPGSFLGPLSTERGARLSDGSTTCLRSGARILNEDISGRRIFATASHFVETRMLVPVRTSPRPPQVFAGIRTEKCFSRTRFRPGEPEKYTSFDAFSPAGVFTVRASWSNSRRSL
jgi:hypothetical protein